ncbi:hypothetical protein G8759_06190 [Spirosoma aureum]|uniref:Phage integrase SAM-like domain-containing protein n=1 Tax=Spirosoma aureum TaxID=2692134 RepID=A0A6G9AIV5_9BACT|nr:phage integrase SAM-like domain-containing protein [Spirosoma aureum]QIP12246.1 hypothetical protein G8759_06190 [Spirosoma aureum]
MNNTLSRRCQTVRVRFEFRKTRATKHNYAGTADALPDCDGCLYVKLYLNDIACTPFSTRIKTFRSIWDGRKALRVSQESQALTKQIVDFQTLIETVHEELCRSGRVVTLKAIQKNIFWLRKNSKKGDLSAASSRLGPLEVVSLATVYKEFRRIRSKMIQENGIIRKPDEISLGTYKTYGVRWRLIDRYLKHIGEPDYPVLDVNVAFATNLQEFIIDQRKTTGMPYDSSTVRAVITLLKSLLKYAVAKGYLGDKSPLSDYTVRGGSTPNPNPITREQLDYLETLTLSPELRAVCDSWMVAAELCMHHADYLKLQTARIIDLEGEQFVQLSRTKQKGTRLKQTVFLTPRTQRIILKYGGLSGLVYEDYNYFSKRLVKLSDQARLVNEEGKLIKLRFGDARDTGLTQWAIEGANSVQLSTMGGWSKPSYSDRYIKNALGIVSALVKRTKETVTSGSEVPQKPAPNRAHPFLHIHKAS